MSAPARAGVTAMALDGARVLVTGHTGFKGAWLSEWLLQAGARVTGIALPPEPADSLFETLRLDQRLDSIFCDIRDTAALAGAVARAKPEIVFHLAAQALVRRSYREPALTWETNVSGTINVLEAARALGYPVSVVAVTTDKVYRNHEWEYAYREVDELGGHDPYSASKAACEIAVASWRASFSSRETVSVATARAGNVIGGGDFSADRIVPDCYRAWNASRPVEVRNPVSTRPWQHVLEPLSGYLALMSSVQSEPSHTQACNFGPGEGGNQTVGALVSALSGMGAGRSISVVQDSAMHEARSLSLAIDRARARLGWAPRLSFEKGLAMTDEAYVAPRSKLADVIQRQVAWYRQLPYGNPVIHE